MSEITSTREVLCPGAPAAVWKIVADTDRINQAMGMARVSAAPLSGAGAARFLVTTRLAGLKASFEEQPFEWFEHERLAVKRVMRGGPIASYRLITTLAPIAADQTRVTLTLAITPRFGLLAPLVRWQGQQTLTRHTEAILRLCTGAAAAPAHASPKALARAEDRLRRSLSAGGGDAEAGLRDLSRRLVAHVRDAADADLARLRPFALADAWQVDRRDLVAVCLAAVPAGLLELSWDLICPSCRMPASEVNHLDELADHGACQLCDLTFNVDFDRAIEVSFRPNETVRFVDDAPFCISGAGRTPHVVAQAILPARGVATLTAPAAAGRYRLFVRGGAVASLEVVAGGPASADVAAAGDTLTPASSSVAPRGALRVTHADPDERHVKIERLEWASQAATAQYVSTMPAFRRMFAGETLRTGVALRVSQMAILFSDLKGSTALYTREGDAVAYRVVTDHFRLLARVAEANQGTVVKTIGDAVMAVFLDEADAVRAAVAMQKQFAQFRRDNVVAASTALRLGIFSGPCFAVTANRIIDYFGQTVNLAARLEGQSAGDEIVLPAELADRAEAGDWLVGAKVHARVDVALKGIDGLTKAARVSIDA